LGIQTIDNFSCSPRYHPPTASESIKRDLLGLSGIVSMEQLLVHNFPPHAQPEQRNITIGVATMGIGDLAVHSHGSDIPTTLFERR
jgi:hypothetical protein